MTTQDDLWMSELADGQLDSDRANELLLGVLEDPPRRRRLAEMLRLRQMTTTWRTQRPAMAPLVVIAAARPAGHGAWAVARLAMAACVGGLLVMGGLWASTRLERPAPPGATVADAAGAAARGVSSEQMQQVASVFELHESVAGPLAWYAADEQSVRVEPASADAPRRTPIAVLLRLGNAGTARSLVIVCRDDQPAVIDLPESPDRPGLRVYLWPRQGKGQVSMQYAIAVEPGPSQAPAASVSGRRGIATGSQVSLGQLAMGEATLNVEASAWPMRGVRE